MLSPKCFVLACVAVLACGAMSGCSSFRGGPEPPLASKTIVKKLSVTESDIGDVLDDAVTVEKRNAFLRKLLALIDIRFDEFVRQLNSQKNGFDASTSLTSTALGIAGTLVGSPNSKTNLAAVSAFISGGKGVVDKTYFYENSVPALVASMMAARGEVRLKIANGMNLPVETYTSATAIYDLLAYSQAGTLLGSLQYIQATSSATAQATTDELRSIGDLTGSDIDLKTELTKALAATNPNAGNLGKLNGVLTDLNETPGVPSSALELRRQIQALIRRATPDQLAELDRVFKARSLYPPAPAAPAPAAPAPVVPAPAAPAPAVPPPNP